MPCQAAAELLLPTTVALLKKSVEADFPAFAVESAPMTMAVLPSPLAVALALEPSPIAALPRVLSQPPPLPMPLMDAQVALAVPAPPSVAAASADATAPSSTPPAIFLLR